MYVYYVYPAMSKSSEKGIGGLIVHGFEFNRVKQKTIKLVFVAFPLSTQH